MKKLKFLAFALFTVLACVSFASCSDDDKDEPEMPSPSVAKRLVKVSTSYGYDSSITYDSQGRIIEVIQSHDGQTEKTITYTYSSSQISVTEASSSGYSSTEIYRLNNGLISELQGETTYSYEGGRISKWRDVDGSNKTFEWSNDDISSTSTKWSDEPSTIRAAYEYSDNYDYGRIVGIIVDSNDLLYDDFDPYLVMQGFFGTTPLHLPQDASDGYGYNYAWSYEFDEDGYPISFTEYHDGSKGTSLSFFWEKSN